MGIYVKNHKSTNQNLYLGKMKLLNNLLGIFVYYVMFYVILLIPDQEFTLEKVSYSLILALFFGILNEIHRDLNKTA